MEIEPNGIAQWAWSDGDREVVVDRRMTVDKPTAAFLKAVGHAEAIGEVKVKASKDERAKMAAPESDADSLKKLHAAALDGSWHVGNHEAFLVFARDTIADIDRDLSIEGDEALDDDGRASAEAVRATLEHGSRVSAEYLKLRADGLDHEHAVRAAAGLPETTDDEAADAQTAHARAVARKD